VQYFSGTAVYRKVFDWAPEAGKTHPAPRPPASHPASRLFLDLGTVKETAQVRLNGQDLGVVWCHPWRVEITGTIKPGGNTLEIEVVNLWPNRLAGDSKLPADQRRTRTNVPIDPRKPLLASGLLGPVVIQASAPEAACRESAGSPKPTQ
jgi:hypothetical protein